MQPSPPFPPLQSRRLVFGTSFRHRLNTTDLHQISVGAPSRSGGPSGSEGSGESNCGVQQPGAGEDKDSVLLLLSWGSVDVLVCRLRLILFSSCNFFFWFCSELHPVSWSPQHPTLLYIKACSIDLSSKIINKKYKK